MRVPGPPVMSAWDAVGILGAVIGFFAGLALYKFITERNENQP